LKATSDVIAKNEWLPNSEVVGYCVWRGMLQAFLKLNPKLKAFRG